MLVLNFTFATLGYYVSPIFVPVKLLTVLSRIFFEGINCTLEEWRKFLTQTLTGALAAPKHLFPSVIN